MHEVQQYHSKDESPPNRTPCPGNEREGVTVKFDHSLTIFLLQWRSYVFPRLDRCRLRGRIRWSRGPLVRTHRTRVQQVASKRLRDAWRKAAD